MNLLLLDEDDLRGDGVAVLEDARRCRHLVQVHRAEVGQELRVGRLGGRLGRGRLRAISPSRVELEVVLDTEPPPPVDVRVVLALPRPKVLRRVLTSLVTLGVKQVVVLHSYRVEKSYWQSPMLTPAAIDAHLRLALEQAVDTVPPVVEPRRFFKPFVEDELEGFASGCRRLVAHPRDARAAPSSLAPPLCVAFGPEGGFIDYEIGMLAERGFEAVELGRRLHRVETAVPLLLGRVAAG